MPVSLTSIPVPGTGGAVARLHADPDDACRHLSNHVLVEPECYAWAALLPRWAGLLGDDHASHERHNERTQLQHTGGALAQELYDAYAAILRDEVADADHLRWVGRWDPPGGASRPAWPVTVGLGTRAVLMVFEKHPGGWVLKTGFIPGQGDPLEVTRSGRARAPRANRPPRPAPLHLREQAQRTRREAGWSPDEWYFYRVVRPAVQFLRRQHAAGRATTRGAERHYALVYEHLPNDLARHGPEVWHAARRACGRPDVGKTA